MYYLLEYDYVENIVQRREPFRAGHIAKAQDYFDQGKIIMAGATGSPVTGATFVFKTDDENEIHDFVSSDPYKINGLVTDWRIIPWTVVIGS